MKRNISPISLKNLYQSNREANQLTKESIETALLFLLETKEMSQISISELVRKAGVSRNAFYRNYKSKEEILERAYEAASQQWMEKWQQLQEKVQRTGLQQSMSDFVHEQMEKHASLSNVSQWMKERAKKTEKEKAPK